MSWLSKARAALHGPASRRAADGEAAELARYADKASELERRLRQQFAVPSAPGTVPLGRAREWNWEGRGCRRRSSPRTRSSSGRAASEVVLHRAPPPGTPGVGGAVLHRARSEGGDGGAHEGGRRGRSRRRLAPERRRQLLGRSSSSTSSERARCRASTCWRRCRARRGEPRLHIRAPRICRRRRRAAGGHPLPGRALPPQGGPADHGPAHCARSAAASAGLRSAPARRTFFPDHGLAPQEGRTRAHPGAHEPRGAGAAPARDPARARRRRVHRLR